MAIVNNSNFLIKDIPKFHPIAQKYDRINYWRDVKRKYFEGEWSGGRWCPPELYFHVNLSTIQFLGGGRKVSGIGRPWFRDIEWEKAFIYSEACGFSGFRDDPEYTCLREVEHLSKDEIYREYCLNYKGELIEDNYASLFKTNGELKKYWPARTYLWREFMSHTFGSAMYLNQARNVLDMEGRGGGKSYWASSCIQHSILTDGCRNYDDYLIGRKEKNFRSISQTLVGAIEAKYSSDLLSKVKFSLEHLPGEEILRINGEDKIFPSPLMPEIIGSWEPGAKSPIRDALSGSSIVHRTFQDNPLAANGTRPTRAFLEEVGFIYSIHEILGAVEATQPNKQSNKYLPIYMLGTGGYTTTGTALWLKEIFYNPEAYDCLAFEDIWEQKGQICYFLPATKGQNDFKEGPNLVSNEEKALASIEKARAKAKASNNKVKLLTEIINQPIKPSEVFLTMEGNFFPVQDLSHLLADLESRLSNSDPSYKYDMAIKDGKVSPVISTKMPIREFPLKKGFDMDACIEIWEKPKFDSNGEIPFGRYLAGWDPVQVDDNTDSTQSLQSLIIMDSWTERIVAEYTARTYLAEDYYEQARRLLMYYRAICNYESNIKGPYAYFKNNNSLHLLCETPDILRDVTASKGSSVGNKSLGTVNSAVITSWGLELVRSWLESKAYDKEESVRNLDLLKSPGIIKELISYNRDINTDRVSALIMLMILKADRLKMIENSKQASVKSKTSSEFWRRAYRSNKQAALTQKALRSIQQ